MAYAIRMCWCEGSIGPNIHLRVDTFQTEDEKLSGLIRRVRFAEKPGIVYVATRKNAEAIVSAVREDNIEAVFYHAGLKAAERHEIQDRFMNGQVDVIVATNAFGMGVDKADVRFVYHFDILIRSIAIIRRLAGPAATESPRRRFSSRSET